MSITNAQRLERLRNLRRVMRARAKKDPLSFDLRHVAVESTEAKCGTTACVIGWAGLDPWFRRHGLRTVPGAFNGSVILRGASNSNSFAAWRGYFGLNPDEASCLLLYGPPGTAGADSVTAAQSAAYIDKLIARYAKSSTPGLGGSGKG